MPHHERLCMPLEGAVGVRHDFIAGQSREVREQSRVDQRGIREALEEGNGEVRKCIHGEGSAYWRGAERGLPVEWHDIGIQACAQGTMGIWRPGLE